MELPVLLAILATIAVGTYFQTVTGFGLGIIVIGLTVSLNLVSLPVIAAVVSIVTFRNSRPISRAPPSTYTGIRAG